MTEIASVAELPKAAHALFGVDVFSTTTWYDTVISAGLPHKARCCFHVVTKGSDILAVLPMKREAGLLSALTTPYTCLWHPLLAKTVDPVAIGTALAPGWRRAGLVRLDCLEADSPAIQGITTGLRQVGLCILPFDHFGNWHMHVAGMDWASYLASRPGQLRSPLMRQMKRLMQVRAATFVLTVDDDVEAAIAAYEAVYAASWKEPEPYPHFNATLIRASAASGSLRLGVLRLDGQPVAVQLWLVHDGWAAVMKLAYDETHRALAPGNVLTALILRHLLNHEQIQGIDFGRGDDAYKKLWTDIRRMRVGALVANPLSPMGLLEIAKHKAGKIRRALVDS